RPGVRAETGEGRGPVRKRRLRLGAPGPRLDRRRGPGGGRTWRKMRGRAVDGAGAEIPGRRVGTRGAAIRRHPGRSESFRKDQSIDRLLEKADTSLIGGAMTYTFRLALGR